MDYREYMEKTDRVGKIWIWTALVVVLMVPVAICVYYHAWPSGQAVLKGLIGVAPIYWTVGVIEVITYTPMLGTGGTYLAFVTGNLTSIKAPSATTTPKGTKTPTEPASDGISKNSTTIKMSGASEIFQFLLT